MKTHFYKKDNKLFFALVGKPIPGDAELFYTFDNVATEQHKLHYAYEYQSYLDSSKERKIKLVDEVKEANKEASGLIKKVEEKLGINKTVVK